MKKLLFIVCAAAVTAACCRQPIGGYVVGKEYIPAHTTSHYNAALKVVVIDRRPDQWLIWLADSV